MGCCGSKHDTVAPV